MLKSIITELSQIITDSEIITRYGGYCDLQKKVKSKTDFPVGIGKDGDCKGNSYTYDDRVATSGFLILDGTDVQQISTQYSYLIARLHVYVFTNHLKYDSGKYYEPAISLMAYIKQYLSIQDKDIKFNTQKVYDTLNAEFSIIQVTVKIPMDCAIEITDNPQTEC